MCRGELRHRASIAWPPTVELAMLNSCLPRRIPRQEKQRRRVTRRSRRRGNTQKNKFSVGMETELKLGPPGESRETDWKKSVFKVVGWPPYRQGTSSSKKKKIYVKVSMDGAPFLRKLELTSCSGYSSLYSAVHAMFESGGLTQKDYSVIYEDNDGDWMLVGDVPWMMFTATCRRLRGMKKTPC